MSDYMPRHGRLVRPFNYTPTDEEDQIIRASAIGDGCILYPYAKAKNPRLCWNMGNKEHAKMIAKSFKFLDATLVDAEQGGFGDRVYRIQTKVHPLLKGYHEELYPLGVKTITKRFMSKFESLAWAWLYMDDGHYCRGREVCYIHTEGYSLGETEIIINQLKIFIGMEGVRVHTYKGGKYKRLMHCIAMRKGESSVFIKKIKSHIHKSMEYKTG